MGKNKKKSQKKQRSNSKPISNATQAQNPRAGFQKTLRWITVLVAVVAIVVVYQVVASEPADVPTYQYRVVAKYPHDPDAFTQGLVYLNGKIFESTGLRGQSSLRGVDPESGQILSRYDMPADLFGEGLAFYKGVLVQLTYTSETAYVYNSSTFEILRQYAYNGEGWGLTYDGTHFIMSNGSSNLQFREPNGFEVVRNLEVTYRGKPLNQLNELEFIEGEIWANVWRDDSIYRINPKNGKVTGMIDLSDLLTREDRTGREDVLNGIAYDSEEKRIFVTGKRYAYLYQIALIP